MTDKKSIIINSGIECLRDPFVLCENGVYYIYGTGWVCFRNKSGKLDSGWEAPVKVVAVPKDSDGDHWAPEVHKYKDGFYMFTTYHSSQTGMRGCTVLKASNPMGPFEEISNGHLTPADWDCIDGTLYIDKDSQPWMVFVHEWTCQPDKIGSFACAKLSDDLSRFVSEPYELFRADAPSWARGGITDGCFMHTLNDGTLLMLWSNFDAHGYYVGIARSESGLVTGPWKQDDILLYSKSTTGEYDGGHGMLFKALDGKTYLSIHSPNRPVGERREMPVFIPVTEKDGTLLLCN